MHILTVTIIVTVITSICSESFEKRTPRCNSVFKATHSSPVDLNYSISSRPPAPLPREALDDATDYQQKDLTQHFTQQSLLDTTTQHCTQQSLLDTTGDTTVDLIYDTVQVYRPAIKEQSKFQGNISLWKLIELHLLTTVLIII